MAIVGYEWFILGIGLIIVLYVVSRLMRRRAPEPRPTAPVAQAPPTIIKEREVIKEVVMVPCRYCGGLMPQTSLFCPNCGGRRQ